MEGEKSIRCGSCGQRHNIDSTFVGVTYCPHCEHEMTVNAGQEVFTKRKPKKEEDKNYKKEWITLGIVIVVMLITVLLFPSLGILYFGGLALCVYFLPSVIACTRDHNNAGAITVLNLFAGWTAIGWIVSIVWSMTDNTESK